MTVQAVAEIFKINILKVSLILAQTDSVTERRRIKRWLQKKQQKHL